MKALRGAVIAAAGCAALLGCHDDLVAPGLDVVRNELTASEVQVDTIKSGLALGSLIYDGHGRLARYEFGTLSPDDSPQVRQTLYAVFQYAGDRRTRGRSFVRKGEEFVKSREWSYAYDSAGRLEALTTTVLLNPGFNSTHAVSKAHYSYDGQDRLVEIRGGGARTVIHYGPDGNVETERLHTTEGAVVVFRHWYDEGVNPLYRTRLDGIMLPIGSWALVLSPNNVVRTETSLEGQEGAEAVHTVEIAVRDDSGLPTRMVHRLWNTRDPENGEEFVIEYAYAPH
jgi:hypothetical protein